MNYNKTILMGNLARDPENKAVGDTQVTRLVVAASDPFTKEHTSYFDVECWGKLAEICNKYLSKGRSVHVDGRLVQDRWEKDGKKNSKIYIKADSVIFLSNKNDKASAEGDSAGKVPESNTSTEDDEVPF